MDGVPLPDGFGPAPARSEGSTDKSLEASEKAIAAERQANALRGAQTGEKTRLLRARQQIGETGETVANGLQRSDPVVLVAQMRARTRPPPILRPFRPRIRCH